MKTYAYGYPRIGKNREYKKIIENYWKKEISDEEFQQQLDSLVQQIIDNYQKYVDFFPSGEMTLFDNMLDTAIILGIYNPQNISDYFNLCRGEDALELTKWFNTNYHYLVPQIKGSFKPQFKFLEDKIKRTGTSAGIPYLIGPYTFLKLSKGVEKDKFADYFFSLGEIYRQLTKNFAKVHLDEPAFVTDVSEEEIDLIKKVYNLIGLNNNEIYLFTYYDGVDFLKEIYDLPVAGIGLDFVNGKENLEKIEEFGFPKEKALIAGLVNGRNIWKTNLKETLEILKFLEKFTPNLFISNAAPLYHLPLTKDNQNLPEQLERNICFAQERLQELKLISDIYNGEKELPFSFQSDELERNPLILEKIKNIREEDFKRELPYSQRYKLQKEFLSLPKFPTTTIGSFPQTEEVREKRKDFKNGKISQIDYQNFIEDKIEEVIKLQEEIGLDVLVHGEFERSDMVEFFAQKLEGFATTTQGWIISYGTRCYRPPIIYKDISRSQPLTIKEIIFAQSKTAKPVKGMLTGPVTIISWSYAREDISLEEVAYQLSLCLREEIEEYQKNGIKIVQIDEPAFKEKAPLKKRKSDEYFRWAINSFKLATSGAKPQTQVHTHMCYSEFSEIIDKIVQMDFDVISLEAARSKADVIESFGKINFDRQIGLGVWDIHSPVIPSVEEMEKIVKSAIRFISPENLWINPDCGLKTRNWKEVVPALKNLVKLAQKLRE